MNGFPRQLPAALLVAGSLLLAFLALPWLLMACRMLGMPAWVVEPPMVGWLRVYALAPVWLLLGALVALAWAVVARAKPGSEETRP